MDWYRLKFTIGMYMKRTAIERAEYAKSNNIFHSMGNNCMLMFRKVPLHSKLISFGNNVWVASNVSFITHDVIHRMINNMYGKEFFSEKIGCIKLEDNVFIGANTTILSNVKIGPNVIIGAGSLVNKDIREGVYGGVPARYICSIDEYVKKRNNEPLIEYTNGNLSKTTIDQYWKLFEER